MGRHTAGQRRSVLFACRYECLVGRSGGKIPCPHVAERRLALFERSVAAAVALAQSCRALTQDCSGLAQHGIDHLGGRPGPNNHLGGALLVKRLRRGRRLDAGLRLRGAALVVSIVFALVVFDRGSRLSFRFLFPSQGGFFLDPQLGFFLGFGFFLCLLGFLLLERFPLAPFFFFDCLFVRRLFFLFFDQLRFGFCRSFLDCFGARCLSSGAWFCRGGDHGACVGHSACIGYEPVSNLGLLPIGGVGGGRRLIVVLVLGQHDVRFHLGFRKARFYGGLRSRTLRQDHAHHRHDRDHGPGERAQGKNRVFRGAQEG